MRRRMAATLATLLLLGVVPAFADDPASELDEVQRRLGQLASEIESAQGRRSALVVELDRARVVLEEQGAEVSAAQGRVDAVSGRIATKDEQLGRLRSELDDLASDLVRTRIEQADLRRTLRRRAADLYMAASLGGGLILGFDDLADLELALEYSGAGLVEQMVDLQHTLRALGDQELGQQAELDRRQLEVEAALASLQSEREDLESELRALRDAEAETAQLVAAQEHQLSEVEEDIRAADQHRTGLQADAERLRAELDELEQAAADATTELELEVEEEAEEASGLAWPLWGPVSSPFGWRVHPIFGDSRMHTGIDIDGPWGAPIVAAAGGIVILAGPYGGYGNTVAIAHGDGYTTIYAHQSSVAVVVGEWVDRAEVIGYVGCTGLCTGAHLHFETRLHGEALDPMTQLP